MDGPRLIQLANRSGKQYLCSMKLPVRHMVVACVACFLVAGCGQSAPRISLHSAVQKGDLQAVRQHIAAGTDLNVKDASGWTPLHLAAMKGDLAMATALCEAGADVKRTGQNGKTPLDVAREKGKTEIVQYLEARKAKPSRGLIDGGLGVSEALDGF